MLFIIYVMTLSINLINICDGSQETGYIEDETVQRRKLQNEKKKNVDNFQMKKKETFVVTPPFDFEHKVVTLGKRTSDTFDGTLESFEHKAVKMDDRRKSQHKDQPSDKSIDEKRVYWTDEMDDSARPDVAHAVSKPFQHKGVPSDKSIVEKRAHWMDEMDDTGRPDDSYAVNDKDDHNTNDIEGNEYGNDLYDAYYDDYDTNPPKIPEYDAQKKLEAVMDVLSKQNAMVEKLIDLYQSEMSNKQFEKLIDSINRKQYLQVLKNRRPSNARTGDKKDEGKKEEKKASTEKKASKEKHHGPESVNNIIRVDETEVKKKLAQDPFVKRILDMAKWKKKMYIKKKKQEEELERAEG